MPSRKKSNQSKSAPAANATPSIRESLGELADALKTHRLLLLLLGSESTTSRVHGPDNTYDTWFEDARALCELPKPRGIAYRIKDLQFVLKYEAALSHYEGEVEKMLNFRVGDVVFSGPTPELTLSFKGAHWMNRSRQAVKDAARILAAVGLERKFDAFAKQADAISVPLKDSAGWSESDDVPWSYVQELRKLEGMVARATPLQRRAGIPELARGKSRKTGRPPISFKEESHRIMILEAWDKVEGEQTPRHFCREHGISPADLEKYRNWRKKRQRRRAARKPGQT